MVSVKVDSVDEVIWRRINRPHPSLRLSKVLDGILDFSRSYEGLLISETMHVHDVNTSVEYYRRVAEYLKDLSLRKAYISIPVRPPAEAFAKPPLEEEVIGAYKEFSKILGSEAVELLNMPEPPPTMVYGDPATWLLNMISVHPLRIDYAVKVLRNVSDNPKKIIEELLEKKLVMRIQYEGNTYLLRNFKIDEHSQLA